MMCLLEIFFIVFLVCVYGEGEGGVKGTGSGRGRRRGDKGRIRSGGKENAEKIVLKCNIFGLT